MGRHLSVSHSIHGVCGQTPPRQIPPPIATAADSTHPTGMHSCFFLKGNFKISHQGRASRFQSIFFIFMQFSAKNMPNNRLAPPGYTGSPTDVCYWDERKTLKDILTNVVNRKVSFSGKRKAELYFQKETMKSHQTFCPLRSCQIV